MPRISMQTPRIRETEQHTLGIAVFADVICEAALSAIRLAHPIHLGHPKVFGLLLLDIDLVHLAHARA
jgi:hypothetical protein